MKTETGPEGPVGPQSCRQASALRHAQDLRRHEHQQFCLFLAARLALEQVAQERDVAEDRKSTRLDSSHVKISYAVFCLKKKHVERDDQLDGAQTAQVQQ